MFLITYRKRGKPLVLILTDSILFNPVAFMQGQLCFGQAEILEPWEVGQLTGGN